MQYILKVVQNADGSRPPLQTWDSEIIPDGYAACHEQYIPVFTAAKGFVNINAENGAVTSMTENTVAKKAWEVANPPAQQVDPITQIQLAVAELAEAAAQNNLNNKLAIAELAEIVAGGK